MRLVHGMVYSGLYREDIWACLAEKLLIAIVTCPYKQHI